MGASPPLVVQVTAGRLGLPVFADGKPALRSSCSSADHAGIGIEQFELTRCAEVPDDEGSFADSPKTLTSFEVRELVDLCAGKAEALI